MNLPQKVRNAGTFLKSKSKKIILTAATMSALAGGLQSCDNLTPEGRYKGTEKQKLELFKAKEKFNSSMSLLIDQVTEDSLDVNNGVTISGTSDTLYQFKDDMTSPVTIIISKIVKGEKVYSYVIVAGRVEKKIDIDGKTTKLNDAGEITQIYKELNNAMVTARDESQK